MEKLTDTHVLEWICSHRKQNCLYNLLEQKKNEENVEENLSEERCFILPFNVVTSNFSDSILLNII